MTYQAVKASKSCVLTDFQMLNEFRDALHANRATVNLLANISAMYRRRKSQPAN